MVGGDCLLESAPLAEGELLGGNSLVVTSMTLTGHVCLLVTGGVMFWPELVDFRTPEVR